jgi:hypothetical protein
VGGTIYIPGGGTAAADGVDVGDEAGDLAA